MRRLALAVAVPLMLLLAPSAFADEAADRAEACCTRLRKPAASFARLANWAGFAAIADITAGSDASAAKPGSWAS